MRGETHTAWSIDEARWQTPPKIIACGSCGSLRSQEQRWRDYAVMAFANSAKSSSSSSSIGAKVESGLVDRVIGLRLPNEDELDEDFAEFAKAITA